MTTDDNELERFASALMQMVRDPAIEESDRLASGRSPGPTGERWKTVLRDEGARRAITELLPDVVDQVLFELLRAADYDELELGWKGADGRFVRLSEVGEGEMSGWLMATGGWRAQYSSQRRFDPFADLGIDEPNS